MEGKDPNDPFSLPGRPHFADPPQPEYSDAGVTHASRFTPNAKNMSVRAVLNGVGQSEQHS
jgi:hypothetical protein